jgi:hypothetical protein
MPTLEVSDANDAVKHLAAHGAGTGDSAGDPLLQSKWIENLPAALVNGRLSVDVGASVAPAGVSTAALQTAANDLLAAANVLIDAIGDLIAARLPAALVGGRLSVDVGATAAPAGVSTAALQTAANTLLDSIEDLIIARLPATGAASEATLAKGLSVLPPQASGAQAVGNFTANAAGTAEQPLLAGAGFYEFECVDAPAAGQNGYYVYFGAAGMGPCTSSNGWHVPPNGSKSWDIPAGLTHFRTLRAGTGADAIGKFQKTGT